MDYASALPSRFIERCKRRLVRADDPDAPPRSAVTAEQPSRTEVAIAAATHSPKFVLVCAFVVVLNVIGLVMVLSASSVLAQANYGSSWYFFERQFAWTVLAAVAFIIAARRGYRFWVRVARVLLALCVLLLIAVLIPTVGTLVDGSRRWLELGPIRLQPAEVAKLGLLLASADLLARKRERLGDWKSWRPVVVWMAALSALVMMEPDLGSTLMVVLIGMGLLLVAGIPRRAFAALIGLVVSATTMLILFEPYRRARLLTFLHPAADPKNAGYQLTQSLIALGSGGVSGAGLGAGRSKWLFLPNPHTDFIFAVIGEELGLMGTLLVIGLFAAFALLGFRIARQAPNQLATLLATGITVWITGQAAVNIGAVAGVLPVTGIPLPFISFGGSALVVTMFAAGILANIADQPTSPARTPPSRTGNAEVGATPPVAPGSGTVRNFV